MKEIETQSRKLNHFNVSLVKSALRIIAGVSLCFGMLLYAGVLLIVAEILGIVEEVV